MSSFISNQTSETLYAFPVVDDSTDLCSVLTGLGTLSIGQNQIHTIRDLWTFIRLGKHMATRPTSLALGTAFFTQYAVLLQGNSKVNLPNDLKPQNFALGYSEKLDSARSLQVFIVNSSFTKGILFTANTDTSYTIKENGLYDGATARTLLAMFSIGDTLPPGAYLQPGEALNSPNNKYYLLFQKDDNNIVIYDYSLKVKWAPPLRWPISPGIFLMHTDGRLIYSNLAGRIMKEYWSNAAESKPENYWSQAFLRDDGILCTISIPGNKTWNS